MHNYTLCPTYLQSFPKFLASFRGVALTNCSLLNFNTRPKLYVQNGRNSKTNDGISEFPGNMHIKMFDLI